MNNRNSITFLVTFQKLTKSHLLPNFLYYKLGLLTILNKNQVTNYEVQLFEVIFFYKKNILLLDDFNHIPKNDDTSFFFKLTSNSRLIFEWHLLNFGNDEEDMYSIFMCFTILILRRTCYKVFFFFIYVIHFI